MLNTAAALAMFWAMAFSGSGEPQPYEAVVAIETAAMETAAAAESSADASALSAEQAELMAGDPDWRASARLYHAGGGGATGNDSLGCRPIAMRTVAVDPRVIPRRTKLFIRETVGLRMSDGTIHDGYWYASDTGGAIKGANRFDSFWGAGEEARAIAGGMLARGTALLLLPRASIARLLPES